MISSSALLLADKLVLESTTGDANFPFIIGSTVLPRVTPVDVVVVTFGVKLETMLHYQRPKYPQSSFTLVSTRQHWDLISTYSMYLQNT